MSFYIIPFLVIIVGVRELVFAVCQFYSITHLANLLAFFCLLILLLLYKHFVKALPQWLDWHANRVMKESGFVILPYTAGAGGLFVLLGDATPAFVIVSVLSTIPLLWLFAYLAKPLFSTKDAAND